LAKHRSRNQVIPILGSHQFGGLEEDGSSVHEGRLFPFLLGL
jgi:hypothetical protein